MHIEDWSPEFLSRFSTDDYFECLKLGKIDVAMIYLQSHVGYCYWPTKSARMHNALSGREDLMRRLIERCRADGIKVVGYYSHIYNTWAERTHPEWRLIKENGKTEYEEGSRYGLCCPNNDGYRDFLKTQIAEIAEYFNLDAMYYDMTFWPHVCHCEACKSRLKRETGLFDIPKEDWYDKKWLDFIKRRQKWIGEFAGMITAETKSRTGGIPVIHNYAGAVAFDWVAGSTELINEECDYTGGDLYGDLYNHSFACKYYAEITKSKPFEYQTCRVDNRLFQHTVTKREEKLEREIMLTTAHCGASLIIDAIDPAGTLDRRVYDRIGKVFSRLERLEPYLDGHQLHTDVGVYYDTTAKHNDPLYRYIERDAMLGESAARGYSNRDCARNAVKTLIKAHIPVGVVSNGCTERIRGNKAVVAPDMGKFCDASFSELSDYVRDGGKLYCSGFLDERLAMLLDADIKSVTDETEVYIAPTVEYERIFEGFDSKYPLHGKYRQSLAAFGKDVEVLAKITLPYTKPEERRYAAIHSNPPGIETDYPSVVRKRIGKGEVVWSAAPLENEERAAYRTIFLKLLGLLIGENRSVKTDAPECVEIVTMSGGGRALVSCINLNSEFPNLRCDFTMEIKLNFRPSRVCVLPDCAPLAFSRTDDGYTSVNIGGFTGALTILAE
jgi:hypothetical protein